LFRALIKAPGLRQLLVACCVPAIALAPLVAGAQEKKGKAAKAAPKKVEKLVCKLGTEWNHARIAVQLVNGKVNEFAYYSIWKPRTCSLHVQRGDSYSKWEEFKTVTTVTLAEETGAVLINHEPDKYKFLFRDVDRMRYCGTEGKVSGSLTIWRGKEACELEGVMDDDPSKPLEPARAIDTVETKEPPAAAKPPAAAEK
jgi:hypothetical protein